MSLHLSNAVLGILYAIPVQFASEHFILPLALPSNRRSVNVFLVSIAYLLSNNFVCVTKEPIIIYYNRYLVVLSRRGQRVGFENRWRHRLDRGAST